MKKRVYGFWLFFIFLTVTLYANRDDDSAERWERAEKEVGTISFPESFKDSLRQLYCIERQNNLRQLTNVERLPFKKKEKFVFNGGWGPLKAGWGVFDASIDTKNNLLIIEGKAMTNNFVSAFYKVRDYAKAIVDLKGFYPYSFEQHIQENRYSKSDWTLYDHSKGKVYSNRKKDKVAYDINSFAMDYLTLFYYLRTVDFDIGDTFSINCFVHGKDYPILFEVHGREEIRVDAGTFSCLKVQPHLVGEGRGFTRKDRMYLWLSDDERRIPVMGKSKVALGSISMELIHYESN